MAAVLFGQIGRLKPEKTEEYRMLHAHPWPEVLRTISDCHLRNYSIFLEGDTVFSYFEYTGDDYDRDMEKMAADPVTQKWWTHTKPCFVQFAFPPEEFYHDMKCIFHLD